MNRNPWIVWGGALAAIGVTAGAFGAHGLDYWLEKNDPDGNFEIAVRYQMYHAVALVLVGLLAERRRSWPLRLAGWCFVLGTLLFSGCLFGWLYTEWRPLVMVVPIGGTAFILGWVALALSPFTGREGDMDGSRDSGRPDRGSARMLIWVWPLVAAAALCGCGKDEVTALPKSDESSDAAVQTLWEFGPERVVSDAILAPLWMRAGRRFDADSVYYFVRLHQSYDITVDDARRLLRFYDNVKNQKKSAAKGVVESHARWENSVMWIERDLAEGDWQFGYQNDLSFPVDGKKVFSELAKIMADLEVLRDSDPSMEL